MTAMALLVDRHQSYSVEQKSGLLQKAIAALGVGNIASLEIERGRCRPY